MNVKKIDFYFVYENDWVLSFVIQSILLIFQKLNFEFCDVTYFGTSYIF